MAQRVIHVIGGAGGIGRWWIEKVLSSSTDTSIFCYDVNEKMIKSLPQRIGTCLLSDDATYDKYTSNFHPNDWILLAVPLQKFESTLKKMICVIKDGSLVVSLTSVQEKPINLLKNCVPTTSAFLGCHPLFGATIPSPIGQFVVLTEYNEHLEQHKLFKEHLSKVGLILTELSASEHDRYMAVVQALTHFCLLSFAGTIAQNNFELPKLLKLRTPNFNFLYAFASRVLKVSPTTTGSIQSTKEASDMREKFIAVATTFHEKLKSAKNLEDCAEIIKDLRDPLAGVEVAEGFEVSAVAIDSLQRFEESLFKYKTNGFPFVFRHSVTGKPHVVKILSIKHDEVSFEEATMAIKKEDRTMLAIGLYESARKIYKNCGINLPRRREEKIKKRNIKLLSAEEMRNFYKTNSIPLVMKRTFSNPHKRKPKFFEEVLPALVEGLFKCEYLGRWVRHHEESIEIVGLKLSMSPRYEPHEESIEIVGLKLSMSPRYEPEGIVESVKKIIEEAKL